MGTFEHSGGGGGVDIEVEEAEEQEENEEGDSDGTEEVGVETAGEREIDVEEGRGSIHA